MSGPSSASTPSLPEDSFLRPPPDDSRYSRSPCPGLNALANHGFIPRYGQKITILELIHAICVVYNFSWLLAFVLALAGVMTCGNGWSVSLHDLAKHNVIEHDRSMVHDDAPPNARFAPVLPSRSLLDQLLGLSPGSHLTFYDFATARSLRDEQSKRPMRKLHTRIANSEAVLAFLALAIQQQQSTDDASEPLVPKSYLEDWLWEEKLPNGWTRPTQTIGFKQVWRTRNKLEKLLGKIAHSPRTGEDRCSSNS
ncbi:heme-thiolate peroxidase [Gelatoporia subvermispora B]|uniref:Heme-thiolate peroxidase n=1 Tax=Ceriporiopsis subvermispora (strain B) TaxID=914234 RepID=M2R8T7_CERS8|nr:heme-thiolate peroxidase [Gelatoporia subvermispora B]